MRRTAGWAAVGLGAATLAVAAPPPERLALEVSFLAVGGTSRVLAARRLVLEPGMAATVAQQVPRQAAAGPALCTVRLSTAAAATAQLILDLEIEVAQAGAAAPWRRQVRARLWPGTSTLVEAAPEDDAGERLVLSVTVEEAPGEEISVAPPAIELEVRLEGLAGGESVLLQNPRLRTFAGRTAEFFLEYPVPAPGGGTDHLRLDLRLSPGFPRAGRLPLRLELAGRIPGEEGPALYSRDQEATLGRGEPWEHTFTPRGSEASLRLTILPTWRRF